MIKPSSISGAMTPVPAMRPSSGVSEAEAEAEAAEHAYGDVLVLPGERPGGAGEQDQDARQRDEQEDAAAPEQAARDELGHGRVHRATR
jgi:hypothetical protein